MFLGTFFDDKFFKPGKQTTHPDVLAGTGRSMRPLEELLDNKLFD